MFDYNRIASCLTSLVSFDPKGTFKSLFPPFPATSGLYYDAIHPLITLNNIRASFEQMTDMQLNTELTRMMGNSIKQVFNSVWQKKRLQQTEKTLMQDTFLWDGMANIYAKEIKQGRFVGYQIVNKKAENIVTILKSICLSFSEEQSTFNIYIYHSSNINPIIVFNPLGLIRANRPNWFMMLQGLDVREEIMLPYESTSKGINAGGAWYIGYYEDDIKGQALNKQDYNFEKGGCNCSGHNPFNIWSKYLSVQPFYVNNSDINNDKTLFNIENVKYTMKDHTYGMNLNINVQCDLTDLICRNKVSFAQAIQLQGARDLMMTIANSTRNNGLEERIKQLAMYELNDRPDKTGDGLLTRLSKEIEAVNIDFSGLNKQCLPCQNSKISYGSVG